MESCSSHNDKELNFQATWIHKDKNTPTKLTGAFSSEAIDGNGGSVDEDSECEGMVDMGNIGDDDDDDNDDGDVFLDRPEGLVAKLWMEEKMTSTFEYS